jgi:hypothetical protein
LCRQHDQGTRKKDTPKPFSNVLAIDVDGDFDFSVFDSTGVQPRKKLVVGGYIAPHLKLE